MKRIITILLALLWVTMFVGQDHDSVFAKTTSARIIDGKAYNNGSGITTTAGNNPESVQETAEDLISGQAVTKDEIWNNFNLVKNWNTSIDLNSWSSWTDPDNYPGQVAPQVENGIVVMRPKYANDGAAWHYQFNQSSLAAQPDIPYVLYFKSWASGNAPAVVDFESGSTITPAKGGDQYSRYGASPDPSAVGGRSEWNYNLTNQAQWFTFHVTFDQIIPTTIQKVQWMISLSNETVYLDSILLVTQELFDQLSGLPTGNNNLTNSIGKIYPNPVGNGKNLFVELLVADSKVAIYNSLGQKLMEKKAKGSIVKFDVSKMVEGIYFIKTSDGSLQRFVK